MAGLPLWVRAAVVLGVPAVISLYLVWWGTQRADLQLTKIMQVATESAPEHYRATIAAHEAVLVEIRRTREDMLNVMRANCINNARGDVIAENRCWYPPTVPPR